MHVLMCGGLRLTLSVFLDQSPPCFVEQDLSLNLEPVLQIGWPSSELQGLTCLLFPQLEFFRRLFLCLGFYVDARDLSSDPDTCLMHFTKGAIFTAKGFCVVLRDC